MTTYKEGEILKDKQSGVRREVVEDKGDTVVLRDIEGEYKGQQGEQGKSFVESNYEAGIEGNVDWQEGDELIEDEGSETWANYGDVHPRVHGGRFLKATGHGTYKLVITTDLEEQAPGMIQDGERYMIEEYTIYPGDVWKDGKPAKGWSNEMESVISALQEDFQPMDIEDVEYLVPDLPFHMRTGTREKYTSNYWKYLRENYGISTNTEGVSQ